MEILNFGLENVLQEFLFFGFIVGSLIYYYLDNSAYCRPWAVFTLALAFCRLWWRSYQRWLPLKQSWANKNPAWNRPVISSLLTFGMVVVTGLALSILMLALIVAAELSSIL